MPRCWMMLHNREPLFGNHLSLEVATDTAQKGSAPEMVGATWGAAAVPLLLLTAIFFLTFSARVVYAPLMPEIERTLSISHAAAGSLFMLIAVGYFVALVSSGWISARIHHRTTIILSAAGVGLALVGSGLGSSYAALGTGVLLVGAAAGLYLPSAIAALTALIRQDQWGKAIAVHELAPNLGLVLVPLAAEWIMFRLSWRAVPAALGVCTLLMGALFVRFGRGGRFNGEPPRTASIRAYLTNPAFWIMVALFGLGISSTLGIYTMLPLYLVAEHGAARTDANTLVSLSRISGLFMALVGGWAADRFGPLRTLVVVFLATGIATVAMGLAPDRWIAAAVFVQPLPAVCFFPAGFAVLSRIGPASTRNIAVSLTVPLAFMIGGGIVPGFIGFFGDLGSFSGGIVLVGCLITSGAWAAHLLRRTGIDGAERAVT